MALGTPVVCSDRAALPEVAGDAAARAPARRSTRGRARSTTVGRRPRRARRRRAGAAPPRFTHGGVGRAPCAAAYRRPAPAVATCSADRVTVRCASSCSARTSSPTPRRPARVLTRIVDELAARGHELHVVTALPWYRHHAVEPGWAGRLVAPRARRRGASITPGPPVPRRRQAQPGAAGRSGSPGSRCSPAWAGLAAGGRLPPRRRRDRDVAAADARRSPGGSSRGRTAAPLVFNIQDVFPDAAVETGRDHQPARHRRRRRGSSGSATASPTPSPCCPTTCAANVAAKLPPRRAGDGAHHPQLRRHRRASARPTG